jgi:hypothetical protein
MVKWQAVSTIPLDREVIVFTVTGLERRAKAQGFYKHWGRTDIGSVSCFTREPGKASGDVQAVAWRECDA